jgi:hypothetical protein
MSKTSIFLKLEGKLEPIRVSWYGSPSSEELNANILENVGLAPGTPFQLLDARGEPIIITPDLASDTTLQLQVARTSATPEEELLRLGMEQGARDPGFRGVT